MLSQWRAARIGAGLAQRIGEEGAPDFHPVPPRLTRRDDGAGSCIGGAGFNEDGGNLLVRHLLGQGANLSGRSLGGGVDALDAIDLDFKPGAKVLEGIVRRDESAAGRGDTQRRSRRQKPGPWSRLSKPLLWGAPA